MKKKVSELNETELEQICKSMSFNCKECPLKMCEDFDGNQVCYYDLKGPFEEILNKEIELEDYGQRTIEYSKLKECLTAIGYTEKHKIDFKIYSWTRYIETPEYRIALIMNCGYYEQDGIIYVKLCNIVTSTMTYSLKDNMLDFTPPEITAVLESDFDFILKELYGL